MFSTLLLTRFLQSAGLRLIRCWMAAVLVCVLSSLAAAQEAGGSASGSAPATADVDPAFRDAAPSAPNTSPAGSSPAEKPAVEPSDSAPMSDPTVSSPLSEASPDGTEKTAPAGRTPTEQELAEAEQLARAGMKAIQQKDWESAVKSLEAALKLTPDAGNYHHALGVAYMGQQQPNAGWFHFRQAVRLDPAYVPAAVDFMKTWKLLDAQGVFNVGTPLATVVQTLGRPDQADDLGVRLRLVYGFMSLNFLDRQLFSILDLRNLPPEGLHAVDGLAFSLAQDEWKVAYRMLSATQGNTEYVPVGQNLQSWTELFASQRFISTAQSTTPPVLMRGIRERLAANFSDLRFEVLKESPAEVLFVWSISETAEHPAQQELVRLVLGQKDVHRLAYTRKGTLLSEADLKTWQTVLEEAELLPADKLRAYLRNELEIQQEEQLRDISVQILKKQFELIRGGRVEELKVYFVPEQRDVITTELLEEVSPRLEQLKPEELVNQVDLTELPDGTKARLIDKQGVTFTTLIQADGRWFAENVWLETIIK